jgi:hypothetical protein
MYCCRMLSPWMPNKRVRNSATGAPAEVVVKTAGEHEELLPTTVGIRSEPRRRAHSQRPHVRPRTPTP